VGEKFAIFDRNRRLSWKRYEIGPRLLWNVNRNSRSIHVGSDDLKWPWVPRSEGSNLLFREISFITLTSFDLERQSFKNLSVKLCVAHRATVYRTMTGLGEEKHFLQCPSMRPTLGARWHGGQDQDPLLMQLDLE